MFHPATITVSKQQMAEMPPPMDLIAKTVVKEEEEVKTGAPIPFIKHERLIGLERREQMQAANKDKRGDGAFDKNGNPLKFDANIKENIAELRENCSHLHNYMTRMNDEGLVVYCRFGKEYITNLSKQANSISANPSLAPPVRQIATYLINIKKLIRDHNIDSETKDFNRLSTTKGAVKSKKELPPSQFYWPSGPLDKTLVFESRFETGNLLSAIKLSD